MMWCKDIHEILDGSGDRLYGIKEFEKKCFLDLNKLAALVRGKLGKLGRAVLCALITLDVHSRDIVTEMVANRVTNTESFEWQKQLRYYMESDRCFVYMSNSKYAYGYEYLGASPRLVITPLTVSVLQTTGVWPIGCGLMLVALTLLPWLLS